MHFSRLFTLFVAGVAVAAPTSIKKRDLATVSAAFDAISGKVTALDTAVKAFNGELGDVFNAAQDVLAEVDAQDAKVAATSALTLSQALAVANKADAITKVINAAVDSAITKKPDFDKAEASETVSTVLTQFKDSTTRFGATVKSKVPTNAQSIAQSKINNILNAIQRGITAFA